MRRQLVGRWGSSPRMNVTHTPPFPRRDAPGFCGERSALGITRARGTPGADAPAASCAANKAHELVTTVTPDLPGVPHAVVLTAWFDEDPWWAALSNPPLWEADAPSAFARGGEAAALSGRRPGTSGRARLGAAPCARTMRRDIATLAVRELRGSSTPAHAPRLPVRRSEARTPLPSTASRPASVTIANAPRSEAGRTDYSHRFIVLSSGRDGHPRGRGASVRPTSSPRHCQDTAAWVQYRGKALAQRVL